MEGRGTGGAERRIGEESWRRGREGKRSRGVGELEVRRRGVGEERRPGEERRGGKEERRRGVKEMGR